MQAKEPPKEAEPETDEEDDEEEEGEEEDGEDEHPEPEPGIDPHRKRRPAPSLRTRTLPAGQPERDPNRPSHAPTYHNIDTADMVQLTDMEVSDAEVLFRNGLTHSEVRDRLNERRAEREEPEIPTNRYTRDQLKAVFNRVFPGSNRGAPLSGTSAPSPAGRNPNESDEDIAIRVLEKQARIRELTRKNSGAEDLERMVAAVLDKRGIVGGPQTQEDPELSFLSSTIHEGVDLLRDVVGKPKRDPRTYNAALSRMQAQNQARPRRPAIQGQPLSQPALPPGTSEPGAVAMSGVTGQPQQVTPPEGPHAQGWESLQETNWMEYLERLAHEKVFPFILDAQAGHPKGEVLLAAHQNGIINAAAVWALATDRKKTHAWDDTHCLRCEVPKSAQVFSQPCPKSYSDKEKLRRLAPESPKTLVDRLVAFRPTIEANTPIPEFGNRTLWQMYVEDPVPDLGNLTIFKTIFSDEGVEWLAGFLDKLKEEAAKEAARSLPAGPQASPGPEQAQPQPQVPPGSAPIPAPSEPQPVRLHPSQLPKPEVPKTEEKKP